MIGRRAGSALAVALWLPALAAAQDAALRWAEVQRRIADPEVDSRERIELLERFIDEQDDEQKSELLAARLVLGSELLARFEVERAIDEFERVVERATPAAIDLRGRAMYGAAQAYELADDLERANALYERIQRELGGTRYADFASIALHRTGRAESERPAPGRQAPGFGSALDRSGTARRLDDLRGKVALLLFADLADDEAIERLKAVIATAREAGVGNDGMLLFATAADVTKAAELARDPAFGMPIVPAQNGFVSPALLTYEVRAVPTTWLIGPDGTIVGRDLPRRRLREAIGALQR